MFTCTTTPLLRQARLTYLRPALRASATRCAVAFAAAVTLAGSTISPPVALHALTPIMQEAGQVYVFWCSIVCGAAPYIAAGASCAAVLDLLRPRLQEGAAARWVRCIAPLSAALFSGCDCSLPPVAGALRQTPAAVRGFALVWAACCNPVGLLCTAAIFGPRMLMARICGGLTAAFLTAAFWQLTTHDANGRDGDHQPSQQAPLQRALVEYCAAGLRNVCSSAAVAATILVCVPHGFGAHRSPALAALAGALLSPCSTSDPVLARALFHSTAQQIVFMLAAQTLDVRQLILLRGNFGYKATVLAAGAAGIATAAAAELAALFHA